mmetsp:Transcript_10537/g.16011  ORF Transcript_10537/g.16011 Transcript_10537/m.16011 type:complete len:88 (+) Transcript_10537:88-351(+)
MNSLLKNSFSFFSHSFVRPFSSVISQQLCRSQPLLMGQNTVVRFMNRNARIPKKANHGKRPCSHARRRAKVKRFQSARLKTKIFGQW